MRKKMCIAALMMLTLAACGQDTGHVAELSSSSVETGMAASADGTSDEASAGNSAETSQAAEELMAAEGSMAAELSYEASVVPYQGETFIKSVFAAGGDMLYVYGIKADGTYFLGCMEEEADVFREIDVSMDDGMRAYNMAVDAQGNCHILWMSVEQVSLNGQVFDSISYEKCCITVVNRDGAVEQEIDVTDVFAAGYKRPYCLAVDEAGNYYLENGQTLVQIKADGSLGTTVFCDGEIEGVGVGESGGVYCVYDSGSGESVLAKPEGGEMVSCGTLPEADAMYSGIYPGADTELLLFSKSGGLYAYDGEEVRERVSAGELPVTGEDISGQGAMADGRLCILAETDSAQTFYYVPAAEAQ